MSAYDFIARHLLMVHDEYSVYFNRDIGVFLCRRFWPLGLRGISSLVLCYAKDNLSCHFFCVFAILIFTKDYGTAKV